MGRGRAKAKQTKVARELKYFSPETDLDRLRAELAGTPNTGNGHKPKAGIDSAADDAPDDALDDASDDDAPDDPPDDVQRRDWSASR